MNKLWNHIGARVCVGVVIAAACAMGLLGPEVAMGAALALTTTTGMLSNGTVLKVSSGSPTAMVVVPNARNIEFDTGSSARVEMTNLTSDWKEFLLGLPDPGSLTFEIDFTSSEAAHIILRNARVNRTRCDFQVLLPGGATPTASMQGFVAKFPVTVGQHDTPIKSSVECYLTGPINLA